MATESIGREPQNVQHGGLRSNNLEPENAPLSDKLTDEDKAAMEAARLVSRPAAVDSQTQRKEIPFGTPLSPAPVVEAANRPYHMSPTFNVGMLEAIPGWKEHASHVPGATAALGSAQTALTQIDEAHKILQKDSGKTEAQRLAVLAASSEKAYDRVYAAMGNSITNIHKGIEGLEADLSKPFEAKGVNSVSAEIRIQLRAMPLKERNEVVIKALADGDDAILSAVLGVHPLASGVDPVRHKIWQRQLAEKRNPQTIARIEVMRKSAEALGRAQSALTQEFELALRGTFASARKIEAHSNDSAVALAKLRGERLVG